MFIRALSKVYKISIILRINVSRMPLTNLRLLAINWASWFFNSWRKVQGLKRCRKRVSPLFTGVERKSYPRTTSHLWIFFRKFSLGEKQFFMPLLSSLFYGKKGRRRLWSRVKVLRRSEYGEVGQMLKEALFSPFSLVVQGDIIFSIPFFKGLPTLYQMKNTYPYRKKQISTLLHMWDFCNLLQLFWNSGEIFPARRSNLNFNMILLWN